MVCTKSSILAFAGSIKTRNPHRNSRSRPFRRSKWALFAGITVSMRHKKITSTVKYSFSHNCSASKEHLELGRSKPQCQHLVTPQSRASTSHQRTAKGAKNFIRLKQLQPRNFYIYMGMCVCISLYMCINNTVLYDNWEADRALCLPHTGYAKLHAGLLKTYF